MTNNNVNVPSRFARMAGDVCGLDVTADVLLRTLALVFGDGRTEI